MTTYSVQNKQDTKEKIKKLEGEIQEEHITYIRFACPYDWDTVREKFSPDLVSMID